MLICIQNMYGISRYIEPNVYTFTEGQQKSTISCTHSIILLEDRYIRKPQVVALLYSYVTESFVGFIHIIHYVTSVNCNNLLLLQFTSFTDCQCTYRHNQYIYIYIYIYIHIYIYIYIYIYVYVFFVLCSKHTNSNIL